MKTQSFVSVVIPAYNQANYLRRAIESVLNQTYKKIEIIVVDDGSTDATPEIISTFKDRIRYFKQENQGLAGARNTGIRIALGNIICLLDADDEWLPRYLEKMLDFSQEHPGAAVYFCSAQAIDRDGKKLPQVLGHHREQNNQMLNLILRANFLIPSTIMLNYSVLERDYCFDSSYRRLQDWELWIRLLKSGYSFKGLPEILVNYRVHDKSLSVDARQGHQAATRLMTKHFGVDDGYPEVWDSQKRQAFGGMHRYHAMLSIKREGDWKTGSNWLGKALEVDPSMALDLDLFYELALGEQPSGYRKVNDRFDLEHTFDNIADLISRIFNHVENNKLKGLRSKATGTANCAMGLVAYNSGNRSLGRRLLLKALRFRPDLLLDKVIVLDIIKSSIPLSWVALLKKISDHVFDVFGSNNIDFF